MDPQQLRVHSVTFNTGTFPPPGVRDDDGVNQVKQMLRIHRGQELDTNAPHDIISVGFQEIHSRLDKIVTDFIFTGDDEWTRFVTSLLYPEGYIQVRRVRLLGIVLAVYAHRKHLQHLREIDSSYVRLSLGGWLGLKGSVSIRFRLRGVSVCFVNSHLAAHDHKLQKRIDDYKESVETLNFKKQEQKNVLHQDYIIWMGDMNMRLKERTFEFPEIDQMIRRGQLAELLEHDQMAQVRRDGEAFSELFEAPIEFPPTYKFKVGSEEYSSKRRPAWTDRILHRCNSTNYDSARPLNLDALEYTSHPQLRVSDHLPVSSTLEVTCLDRAQAVALDVAAYDPIIRFKKPTNWRVGLDGIVGYMFQTGTSAVLNSWDYVALFRANFTSLMDYVAFTWASPCRRPNVEKNVVFLEEAIEHPGSYQLIYFGYKNDVLGVSEVFEIGADPAFVPVAMEATPETVMAEEVSTLLAEARAADRDEEETEVGQEIDEESTPLLPEGRAARVSAS